MLDDWRMKRHEPVVPQLTLMMLPWHDDVCAPPAAEHMNSHEEAPLQLTVTALPLQRPSMFVVACPLIWLKPHATRHGTPLAHS